MLISFVHFDKGGGIKVVNVRRTTVCHWYICIFLEKQERCCTNERNAEVEIGV
jgi:hypothetical protein